MNRDLEKIIEAMIRAPSGDNLQPWQISIINNEIRLSAKKGVDLSLYNTCDQATYFSLGAMVENATIAGEHLGLDVRPELSDQNEIRLTLKTNKQKELSDRGLYESIFKRSTNRYPYLKQKLSSSQKKYLMDAAKNSKTPLVKLVLLDAPNKELAAHISLNEQVLFENKYIHSSFFNALSWNASEPGKMPITALALPLPGRLMFTLARTWKRMLFLNKLGLSKIVPAQTRLLYEAAGAYGALTTADTSPLSFYEAGKVMERIWLTATQQEVAIQPLTGIVLLQHALAKDQNLPLSREHKHLIQKAYDAISSDFSIPINEKILFVFRLGIASKETSQTPRKSISSFVN